MRILEALTAVMSGGAGRLIQRAVIFAIVLLVATIAATAAGLTTVAFIAAWLALFPMAVALGSVATGVRHELRADA